jgi:hypothetical protein
VAELAGGLWSTLRISRETSTGPGLPCGCNRLSVLTNNTVLHSSTRGVSSRGADGTGCTSRWEQGQAKAPSNKNIITVFTQRWITCFPDKLAKDRDGNGSDRANYSPVNKNVTGRNLYPYLQIENHTCTHTHWVSNRYRVLTSIITYIKITSKQRKNDISHIIISQTK